MWYLWWLNGVFVVVVECVIGCGVMGVECGIYVGKMRYL